mgnify:CR=1 FL=1
MLERSCHFALRFQPFVLFVALEEESAAGVETQEGGHHFQAAQIDVKARFVEQIEWATETGIVAPRLWLTRKNGSASALRWHTTYGWRGVQARKDSSHADTLGKQEAEIRFEVTNGPHLAHIRLTLLWFNRQLAELIANILRHEALLAAVLLAPRIEGHTRSVRTGHSAGQRHRLPRAVFVRKQSFGRGYQPAARLRGLKKRYKSMGMRRTRGKEKTF